MKRRMVTVKARIADGKGGEYLELDRSFGDGDCTENGDPTPFTYGRSLNAGDRVRRIDAIDRSPTKNPQRRNMVEIQIPLSNPLNQIQNSKILKNNKNKIRKKKKFGENGVGSGLEMEMVIGSGAVD